MRATLRSASLNKNRRMPPLESEGVSSELGALATLALEKFVQLSGCRKLLVAFSGGKDSTALLHFASSFGHSKGLAVSAAHVVHNLQDENKIWVAHCRQIAEKLGIDCMVLEASGSPSRGESVEAWARDYRYRLLAEHVCPETLLLTGHQLEDQCETILQRVLAGAGPRGLAGMEPLRPFPPGYLGRPLLDCGRSAVDRYVRQTGLSWVQDPSNLDLRYSRNRVRQQLLPAIAGMPDGLSGLLRLGAIQRDLARGLDRLANDVLQQDDSAARDQLPISSVFGLGIELAPYVIKRFVERCGAPQPGERHLRELLSQLTAAAPDRIPVITWSGNALRKYRERLYLTPAALPAPPGSPILWDGTRVLNWSWGQLSSVAGRGAGLTETLFKEGRATVRFRQGGEKFLLTASETRHRELKKAFQAWGIPPWDRSLTPLTYIDESLVAVGSRLVDFRFCARLGQRGRILSWSPRR